MWMLRWQFSFLLGLLCTPVSAAQREAERVEFVNPRFADFPLDHEQELAFLHTPELQAQLVDRTLGRPQKCPLRSELRQWHIYERLHLIAVALRHGKCYEQNKEQIDAMQKAVGGGAPPVAGPAPAPAPAPAPTIPAVVTPTAPVFSVGYHNQVFNTINSITANSDCLLNVKDRGLLPVLADVMTSAGLMAALTPTPNGLVLGMGGLTIGSSLKVLIRLFQLPFNWQKTSDRKQFLDLNCSFFDVRRDIEAAELFDIKDEHLAEHIREVSRQSERVAGRLSEIKARYLAFTNAVSKAKSAFLRLHLGRDPWAIEQELTRVLTAVRTPNAAVKGAGGEVLSDDIAWLNEAMMVFPVLERYLLQLPQLPVYGDFLLEFLRRFRWMEMEDFLRMESGLFRRLYREPLEFYLAKFLGDLRQVVEQELASFWQLPSSDDPTKTNRQYYQERDAHFSGVLAKFADTLTRLATRLEILKAKNPKERFSRDDEGAHAGFDIINEYFGVQKRLFGSLGYKFLHYFTQELSVELASFHSFYKEVRPRVFAPQLSPNELAWACRNVSQLRIIWERAHTAAEVSNDFIETNRGIFHGNYARLRLWLKFIPAGSSYPHLLARQAKSVEFAQEVLAGRETVCTEKVAPLHWGSKHNLGKLMLDLVASDEERAEVEVFWQEKNCAKYL